MDFPTVTLTENELESRSTALIAIFDNGFAVGWKMAVPEIFRESLDIRLTDRRYEGVPKRVWTQGQNFGFNEGAVIYDTRIAYGVVWSEALKHIKVFVQVIESESAKNGKMRGKIRFRVMRPTMNDSSLQTSETFVTTQDEFVCLLQTGKFHSLKGNKLSLELIDLFSTEQEAIPT